MTYDIKVYLRYHNFNQFLKIMFERYQVLFRNERGFFIFHL